MDRAIGTVSIVAFKGVGKNISRGGNNFLERAKLTRVVNRIRAFRVGFVPGLDFEKLPGFNRAGRRSKIENFSE